MRSSPASKTKIPVGIVQGRLTKAPIGQLQYFPQKNWENEFRLAQVAGLDFIELIAEEVYNPQNPIWTCNGMKCLTNAAKQNNLSFCTLCNGEIIKNDLLQSTDTHKNTETLIAHAAEIGCKLLILPLEGRSTLTNENISHFSEILWSLCNCAKNSGLSIGIETNASQNVIAKLFEQSNSNTLGLVLDAGNWASIGKNLEEEIEIFKDKILHIHLKDKTLAGDNVSFGNGIVNFDNLFSSLRLANYKKAFTLESVRGENPLETAKRNAEIFKDYIQLLL